MILVLTYTTNTHKRSQVVPVVRETAAQALAMAAQPLDAPSLCRLLALLLSLSGHSSWHVRHGALVSGLRPFRGVFL